MTKVRYRNPFRTVLAVIAIAMSNGLPAFASTPTTTSESNFPHLPSSYQIAQGLIGQCRQTNRSLLVYSQRSTTSTVIRTLPANTRVTLADNGLSGFIAINAPVAGFVEARYLTTCGDTTPPPPVTDNCRRVIVNELIIRRTPSGDAISTLRLNDRVTLTGQRQALPDPTAGTGINRSWVEISAPVAGWVSPGLAIPNTTSNLGYCTTSPPPVSRACTVVAPGGLITRNAPGGVLVSPGVGAGQTVTITGNRQTINNRVWLEISSPYRAWLSSGYVGNENNLSPNPCR